MSAPATAAGHSPHRYNPLLEPQLVEWMAEEAKRRTEPLYDPAEIRAARYLNADPPPRRWIVPDLLPLGVVGLLASMGGAGKSTLLLQLLAAVAAGRPWLDMDVEHVGPVLAVMAEDDDAELHRRFLAILRHYEESGYVDRSALGERMHVVSRTAEDNRLTKGTTGEVRQTGLVRQIVATAEMIPDLRLIVLDPTSRFRGGNANAEEDATRYVETLEAIREATGATVLSSVHVNKASIREGGEVDQGAVRGSTALVDGARWVATMQRLRRDEAPRYGIEPNDAGRYVRLDVPKSNYTRPWAGKWLRRSAGGILVPVHLEAADRQTRRSEETYATVLERLLVLLRDQGPLTGRHIETHYAGRAGRLAVGKQTVRTVIARAVDENELITTPDPAGRSGVLLSAPETT